MKLVMQWADKMHVRTIVRLGVAFEKGIPVQVSYEPRAVTAKPHRQVLSRLRIKGKICDV
jgi:hypothetical protein